MDSGPAVAGVIGTTKFACGVWGPAVDTAAKTEAYGRGCDEPSLLASDAGVVTVLRYVTGGNSCGGPGAA